MSDFPRMLYKNDGPHEIHGGLFDYTIVHDDEQFAASLADGWHLTPCDARAVPDAVIPASLNIPPDDAPPTRDELKRKATELGIEYPPNIPTDKLAALVAAKV